ncbi:MAG: TIM barrel protein [Candidatus Eremiobacteraeota bacterium]|nr:TIM barrel protein [Candidatus Eremiobacteraeota bacterium]
MEAQKLFAADYFSYIELFVVPGSFGKCITLWRNIKAPFVIHAPHYMSGLNLSQYSDRQSNFAMIREVMEFADMLKADEIIFHPGVGGDIQETIAQLKDINDQRILIENKPYRAIVDELTCNGNSPEDIKLVMDNTGCAFCLDIGHAIYSANFRKVDPWEYFNKFLELRPVMYHLTDGDFQGVTDQHKHFGEGDFPIERILKTIPQDSRITIETKRESEISLDDTMEDVEYLMRICNCSGSDVKA